MNLEGVMNSLSVTIMKKDCQRSNIDISIGCRKERKECRGRIIEVLNDSLEG